jgi:hypothetical protein
MAIGYRISLDGERRVDKLIAYLEDALMPVPAWPSSGHRISVEINDF